MKIYDTVYIQHEPDHPEWDGTWCPEKINDDDVEYTKGTPEQIAKRMIEEAIKELGIVNEFSLTTLRYVTDWLDKEGE